MSARPVMERRQYEFLANTLAASLPTGRAARSGEGVHHHRTACRIIADALRDTNPKFDWSRFMTACGHPTGEAGVKHVAHALGLTRSTDLLTIDGAHGSELPMLLRRQAD